MLYFNDVILAVEGSELIISDTNPTGLMSKGAYDKYVNQGKINVLKRGGGKNGYSLIEFESIPLQYKTVINEKYGGCVYTYMAKQPIRDLIKIDYKAITFFNSFVTPSGNNLEAINRTKFANDAAILNALDALLKNKKELKKILKVTLSQFWNTAGQIIKELQKPYPNSLPTSDRHLKPLYKKYIDEGYTALIDKRLFNSSNNNKVNNSIEHLILSLYVRNKCYHREVYNDYLVFLNGGFKLVDTITGEVFNPANFTDKDGQPLKLSQSTIWRIINKPSNRNQVDKIRLSSLEYNSKHRPHMHRHAPQYSLSKITMDDISIPFKMADGKRAWSYQVYDVASQAVIGKAFARSNDEGSGKDRGLFMQAIIDMFRTITNNGWGVPAQIEVEQHISNTFANDLLNQGYIFPFVRFCRGGNPQEKRAENIINGKKIPATAPAQRLSGPAIRTA